MADENADMGFGDDTSVDTGSRKGGAKGIIPQILKFVAIGVASVIFIVTVVVITVLIMGKGGKKQTSVPVSLEYQEEREIYDWYTSLEQIRTQSNDELPASVVVQVALGYKKDDKVTSTEITQRTVEIRDFLRRYFSERTYEELKPQNEKNLSIQIRDQINDDILSRKARIRDVKFVPKDVVKQY